MKKIKDLNKKQLSFVLILLIVIAGALYYMINIQGDYILTYEKQLPSIPECTEEYDNYKLVSEQCPQNQDLTNQDSIYNELVKINE